jgi:anthranilate/para-aminobenzoate synthase component I
VTNQNIYTIFPYKKNLIKLSDPKSARAIYKNKIVDLKTMEVTKASWTKWFEEYNFSINQFFHKPRVTHLFYELGFLIENENIVREDTILALDFDYQDIDYDFKLTYHSSIHLSLEKSISFNQFNKLFLEGRKELLAGNCYQFNLTCEHIYNWKKNLYGPMDFISSLWNKNDQRGAFGSATYIRSIDKLYLSNSPECLFQLNKNVLSTMPIKGTVALKDSSNFKKQWKKLRKSKKDESELFMIIDLLRNDLARIDLPRAKVIKKKWPLLVPGLLHQYAQIEVPLSDHISLKRILEKIFPGGSVTGAPKKRVIKILQDLEKRERKFYCGSTLIFFKEMKSASINIRSAEIDFNSRNLTYQSGGGITLQSNANAEFGEMIAKRASFIRSL